MKKFRVEIPVVIAICRTVSFCWNLHLRAENIRCRGWPPEHLDADGNHVAERHEEEA